MVTAPELAYMVCATARVGSSHLCDALSSVPGAGRPAEWFARPMIHMRLGEWGMRDARSTRDEPRQIAGADYLARVRTEATANGCLAIKVHWNQVKRCRKTFG